MGDYSVAVFVPFARGVELVAKKSARHGVTAGPSLPVLLTAACVIGRAWCITTGVDCTAHVPFRVKPEAWTASKIVKANSAAATSYDVTVAVATFTKRETVAIASETLPPPISP